ncbi:MAG TPA: VWA domain-containing protein [Acidimicrobiia bacterium]|nr:VWA domain-containing protein [Acidimicrobiia bacterium]
MADDGDADADGGPVGRVHEVVPAFAGFGRELRAAGLPVGTGQVLAFCEGLARLDPTDLRDVYWSGRACLVSRQADLVAYDEAFARYFLGEAGSRLVVGGGGTPPLDERQPSFHAPAPVAGTGREARADEVGQVASDVELLRAKDFAECDPEELAAIGRLLTELVIATPSRKSRRTQRARKGARPDLRRALRMHVRHGGDHRIPRLRPRVRPRPLVLLLDVSGSMSAYSRALLQFAYAVTRGPGRVEVFCFGTRLTRVSSALARRDPDEALRQAAETVVDWEGGTRIGESLQEYLRTWAWRGGCRGAVVVICSDGLERGDPDVLAAAMARLSRLAHRVVWVNPLKAGPAYEPATRGMRAALPHIDLLVSGHNVASLADLAAVIDTFG